MNIEPKKQFINATRELIESATNKDHLSILGLEIMSDPEVFNPGVFFSSQWFATEVANLMKEHDILIEVGCGTGIVSIKTAKENPEVIVYSTDINPKATELTNINAKTNLVSDRIHTYCGDVLDSVPKNVNADIIFWAMPFGYLEPGENLKNRDWQVFDPGYRAISKFFSTAKGYLKESGKLLIGFSMDIGHYELLEKIAGENNFKLDLLNKTQGVEKDSVSMEIWEGTFLS
jgi:release factor glutamine methyltransferase